MPRTAHKIEDFAKQLGTLLGTAERKARSWLDQRQQISKTLTSIRDTASSLLSDLGHDAKSAVKRGRKAMAKSVQSAPRRRRSKISAAGRAAIAAAQRKRWAKIKREKAAKD